MTKFIDVNKIKNDKVHLKEPGKYIVFFYNHSGTVDIKIDNRNIEVELLGLFVGRNEEEYDIHTTQHHSVGESQSNLLIHGIFFDKSRFNYSGLIKIDKDAQLTHAYQKNQNLIMSGGVHIESDPFLEIEANDVYCTHGSTTGELSKDQLYYLENRGIDRQKAERLLLRGFAGKIFDIVRSFGFGKEIYSYEKDTTKLIKR